MIFDDDLVMLKYQIENANDIDELNFIRATNEKKYWWSSIFISGLFYALNGKVGRMFLIWILSFFTIGLFALYSMYTSYRDEKEFNTQMEFYILQRTKELRAEKSSDSPSTPASNDVEEEVISFECPNCGNELDSSIKFCPGCGEKVTPPQPVFCSKCGEKIFGDVKFCPSCGNTINQLLPEVTEEADVVEEAEVAEVVEIPEETEVAEVVDEAEVVEETEVVEVPEVTEEAEVVEVAEVTEAIENTEKTEEN